MARDLYDGKIKPSDLNQDLITQTFTELNDAASQGYGKDWISFPADGKGKLPNELKKNLYAFSGAKTYAELEMLNKLMYDKDGKLLPFNEFSALAKSMNVEFNKNYLQAEWQTARTAAQMAQKWQKLQETKDLFPNLKYRTVGDERVRNDHELLNGIIKPIDDAFWAKYYPPLDWRCRCDVVATAEDPTNDKEEDLPQPQFSGNVALDEEIFSKNGSFFKLLNTSKRAVRNAELSKLVAPYEVRYKNKKTGKKVTESIFHDKTEIDENFKVAKVIVDSLKFNIGIRPHVYVDKMDNPEYLINNKLADRKSPEGLNLRRILNKANDQKTEIVVIDLVNNSNSIAAIVKQLESNFRFDTNYPNIKEVIIVSKDRKEAKHYFRKDIKKKKAE